MSKVMCITYQSNNGLPGRDVISIFCVTFQSLGVSPSIKLSDYNVDVIYLSIQLKQHVTENRVMKNYQDDRHSIYIFLYYFQQCIYDSVLNSSQDIQWYVNEPGIQEYCI